MWETQRMLAQDREVELVRQAERVNRGARQESSTRAWRQLVARGARFVLGRRAKYVPQQLPATND
jgi:hypothetical protein